MNHHLDDAQIHQEWNNALPPRLEIEPGDTVVFDCRDAANRYYSRNSTHDDVMGRGPFRGHPLTGPVRVEGARPGDTLVVESAGYLEPGWLDEEGTPITNAGHVTERIRRVNYGTLEIQVTVNDPKTFTKPWTVTLNQRLMPDTELIEFICQENNRSEAHLVGR